MDPALVVAVLSGGVALASAVIARNAQLTVARLQAEKVDEERETARRTEARKVLDTYRGPLLDAAWQLGDRIDNIRNRDFLDYLDPASGRAQDAKLTTLFRFAHYFGWREVLRARVQLLRFETADDTRNVADLIGDLTWILASDRLDGSRAMLWGDEQRGIGELMSEGLHGVATVRGHASFYACYDDVLADWMERFAADLLAAAAVTSDRLRLLHWALFGLVRRLDDERAYNQNSWMSRAREEIAASVPPDPITKPEASLREHLALPGVT